MSSHATKLAGTLRNLNEFRLISVRNGGMVDVESVFNTGCLVVSSTQLSG
jgi:hypothetical protein